MGEKTGDLVVLAGKTAYAHIQKNGLSPDDIRLVLGASGAAKWLVIHGLDTAIFSEWFKNRKDPLLVLGTSIGAWKFAAAAQKNPGLALDALKHAYIHQYYQGRVSPVEVTRESVRIMQAFLDQTRVDEILGHPFICIAFGAVRCRYMLASRHRLVQLLGILAGAGVNRVSRNLQQIHLERFVFHHSEFDTRAVDFSDFPTRFVPLERQNFQPALTASGAIPFVMEGVADIPGAPSGIYRDGGILDYHPAFALSCGRRGLILYPHFYPYLIPGWFDKKNANRRISGSAADRIILVAPSEKFVSRLPFGRIPDRKDFTRLMGQDAVRVNAWEKAADMGRVLGDEFLEATYTGRIQDLVRPLP